jgi:hypothetical protein
MTPDEFRKLCTSCKTPLAFAESCRDLTEADRKKLSKTAQEIYTSAMQAERENWRIASYEGGIARLAMLAVCSWSQAKRVSLSGRVFPDRGPWFTAIREILTDRRPSWAGDWVTAQLDDNAWRVTWNDVRELMRAGVIERPSTEGYIRLLANSYLEIDPERDADVMETEIWRLFEVETSAFDRFPELDGWGRRLSEWSQRGQIDRDRLINATVDALWRNFRLPIRTGLLRFLETLDPTEDEIVVREESFRELLRSEYGPIVGLALKSLARLQKANRLNVEKLLEAVSAAFGISSLAQPKAALALVDRSTKNSPQHLPAALNAVTAALNHASADVQEIAVDLLAKWKKLDPSLDLGGVVEAATFVVAQQRQRLETLASDRKADPPAPLGDLGKSSVGAACELDVRRQSILERLAALPAWVRKASCRDGVERALLNDDLPPAFEPDPVLCPVLSSVEPIEPIHDVDELIDAVSHLFEVTDACEIERIVDGILRLGGETTENFDGKTEALRQSKFGSASVRRTMPEMLIWSLPRLLKLIAQWLGASFNDPWQESRRRFPAEFDTWNERFEAIRLRFQKGEFGPVLATPTHRGGWVDPRIFVARLKSILDQQQVPEWFDFLVGLLRLAPDFRLEALKSAVDLPAAYGRIVRYALGGEDRPAESDRESAALWLAAGRSRHPRGDLDELRILNLGDGEPDGIVAATFRIFAPIGPQELAINRSDRFITVLPDRLGPGNLAERPTVALAARLITTGLGSMVENWLQELMRSLWPANADTTLACACVQLRTRMDEKSSAFSPVAGAVASLREPDRGWSEIGRVAVWHCLLSRDSVARGIGIDLMIDGITDGRAHPGPLGKSLLQIALGDSIKLNRLADSLREVTRTSVLAEVVVSEILDQLITSWNSLPRDGHHILMLQLELLSSLGQAPKSRSREVLAAMSGGGKSAKLVKQLCSLTSNSESLSVRQAAIEAAQGRLGRAERIARFV